MFVVVINNQVVFTTANFKTARRVALDISGERKSVAAVFTETGRLAGVYEVRR